MENQRQFIEVLLMRGFYSFLIFLFILTFILFLIELPLVVASLKGLNRKSWYIIISILFVSFSVWQWYTPHIPHVYYDQYCHLDLANNLFRHGLCAYTLAGSLNECYNHTLCNAWPPGYHFILSLFFHLFGSTESVAYICSLFFGLLSILLFYILVYLAVQKEEIALWSAFFIAVVPVHLKYTATYSLEIPSLSFILLTGVSVLLYLKYRNLKTLLALITFFACACYIRPENFFLLSVTCFLSSIPAVVTRIKKRDFKFNRMSLVLSLSAILLLPLVLLFYYSFTYMKPPGWNTELFSYLSYFKEHILENLLFFTRRYHPLIMTVIALGGIIIIWRKKMPCINPLIIRVSILWFIICIVLYSSYHTGDFFWFSDSDRYSLNLYITICFFAAITMSWVLQFLVKWEKILCIIVSVFVMLYSSLMPLEGLILKTTQRPLYSEYEFITTRCIKILDPAVPVICCSIPAKIFFFSNVKVMNFDHFRNNMSSIDRVVLFKDFSWHLAMKDPQRFQEMQSTIQNNYYIELIEYRDIGEYRYGFYLLTKKFKNINVNINNTTYEAQHKGPRKFHRYICLVS